MRRCRRMVRGRRSKSWAVVGSMYGFRVRLRDAVVSGSGSLALRLKIDAFGRARGVLDVEVRGEQRVAMS